MIPNTTGGRIKQLRSESRMSVSDLARLMEISPTTIYYWEKERGAPSEKMQQKLSDIFHVSDAYLMCASDELIDTSRTTRSCGLRTTVSALPDTSTERAAPSVHGRLRFHEKLLLECYAGLDADQRSMLIMLLQFFRKQNQK